MTELAIVGGGSWGTALSIVLAPRFGRVRLWIYEADLAQRICLSRENDLFLPGCKLPANVAVSSEIGEMVEGAEFVLGVMPSRHARHLYLRMAEYGSPGACFISATKGLENGTLLRMSEVIEQTVSRRVAVLSGPTFAREVACGKPTAVVVSSRNYDIACEVQRAFSGPSFRLYVNNDPVGVELGAALKNVIAIGAGVCEGLGLGHNTMAALVTRGLAEISRLAMRMGGQERTFSGLAGLGDLVLTCTGELSRNRRFGVELAKWRSADEIARGMHMVAEGIHTVTAAVELARREGVEMPITSQVYAMLYEKKPPQEAIRELMDRSLKSE